MQPLGSGPQEQAGPVPAPRLQPGPPSAERTAPGGTSDPRPVCSAPSRHVPSTCSDLPGPLLALPGQGPDGEPGAPGAPPLPAAAGPWSQLCSASTTNGWCFGPNGEDGALGSSAGPMSRVGPTLPSSQGQSTHRRHVAPASGSQNPHTHPAAGPGGLSRVLQLVEGPAAARGSSQPCPAPPGEPGREHDTVNSEQTFIVNAGLLSPWPRSVVTKTLGSRERGQAVGKQEARGLGQHTGEAEGGPASWGSARQRSTAPIRWPSLSRGFHAAPLLACATPLSARGCRAVLSTPQLGLQKPRFGLSLCLQRLWGHMVGMEGFQSAYQNTPPPPTGGARKDDPEQAQVPVTSAQNPAKATA